MQGHAPVTRGKRVFPGTRKILNFFNYVLNLWSASINVGKHTITSFLGKNIFPFVWCEQLITFMQYYTFVKLTYMLKFFPTFMQNVMHWHIVDTQSFPLEIPSFPKLWDGAYSISERYTFADAAEIVRRVIFASTSLSRYLSSSLFVSSNILIYYYSQLCSKTRNQCIG